MFGFQNCKTIKWENNHKTNVVVPSFQTHGGSVLQLCTRNRISRSAALVHVSNILICHILYHPAAFLVLLLEKHSCQLKWDSKWVFKAFLALDVPLSKLYVIYDQHFKAKVS